MHRRFSALVLSLVVAGTPEMLAMCHAACVTSTAKNDGAAHHTHSHADSAKTTDATTVKASAQTCSHANGMPEATAQDIGASASPATLAGHEIAFGQLPASAEFGRQLHQSPPGPIALATSLRI